MTWQVPVQLNNVVRLSFYWEDEDGVPLTTLSPVPTMNLTTPAGAQTTGLALTQSGSTEFWYRDVTFSSVGVWYANAVCTDTDVARQYTDSIALAVGNQIYINNGSSATVTSGVQANLTLRLTIGDSYLAALNNALVWTDLSAPDLTTASSITLYIGDTLTKAGTALTASSVRVELTSAETETLKELQYPYSLRAVYANPGVVTPVVRSIAIVTAPQPGA